jgi:hypothetical protein
MTTALSKKSGKGITDGVISELATFFDVLPGHEEECAAATQRFVDVVRALDPAKAIGTGLRDTRHVIFDDGRRLLWATTFETEWDPYVDDAILAVGIEHFIDWMQHTAQGKDIVAWLKESGIQELDPNDPEYVATVRKRTAGLKAILHSVQSPATAYYNPTADETLTQIKRDQRLEATFQQVLDDPAAADALQQPVLKPLLEMAAD